MAVVARAVMPATVVATSVTLAVMVVVVTFYVRIKSKRAAEECFDCGITGTADSAVKPDASLSECHLCATADATANKCIHVECGKQSCKCSVTAAVGINHFAIDYFPVLCDINLELLGMTEVLKDLSVFLSYCNFQCAGSLEFSIV